MTRWSARCASRGFAVLALGLMLVLVAVGLGTAIALRGSAAPAWVGWFVTVVGVVVGVAGWLLSSLEARVTDDRFVVAFGPFGLPRRVIPLAEVRGVGVVDVEPMQWGGWGYRWMPRAHATAAVLRRGPGIELLLADERRFVVTVDDAEAGAAAVRDAVRATSRP